MLKKTLSNFRLATLGVAVAGSMAVAPQAFAAESKEELMTDSPAYTESSGVEVAASAAVANMYLWRGQDLGNGEGTPAVSGDIVVSASGAYAGIWGSSGDSVAGTEYDLWAGYGGSIEDFTYDLSVWTYMYPGDDELDTFGQLSEIIVSLGYGPVTFTYYDNIAGGSGYEYYTLEAGYEEFSAKLGYSDPGGDDDTYTHIDLGYAYNDNLSFTLSKIVDADDDAQEDDTLFVVAYSLPIDIK